MKFTIRAVFKRSVTIELDNDAICYAPTSYSIYINGEERGHSDMNVATVEGLTPDTDYTITVKTENEEHSESFHTEYESVLLDVRAFGAHGDGETEDTSYLQAAISACPDEGTVYVPAGRYLCRPLFLKSHMTLWLDEGAVILGDPDRMHYPLMPGLTPTTDQKDEYNLATWEGNPRLHLHPLFRRSMQTISTLSARAPSMETATRVTGGRIRRRCGSHGVRIPCF